MTQTTPPIETPKSPKATPLKRLTLNNITQRIRCIDTENNLFDVDVKHFYDARINVDYMINEDLQNKTLTHLVTLYELSQSIYVPEITDTVYIQSLMGYLKTPEHLELRDKEYRSYFILPPKVLSEKYEQSRLRTLFYTDITERVKKELDELKQTNLALFGSIREYKVESETRSVIQVTDKYVVSDFFVRDDYEIGLQLQYNNSLKYYPIRTPQDPNNINMQKYEEALQLYLVDMKLEVQRHWESKTK